MVLRKHNLEPEAPYEWYEIYHPTNARDKQKVIEYLVGAEALNPVPSALLEYLLSPEPGQQRPRCKTVIVEKQYRDKDHSKALSSFYARSFRSVSSDCTRLHFFSRWFNNQCLYAVDQKKFNKTYLGFCVLRPFTRRRIGRTVLKRKPNRIGLEFPTCQGKFPINLAGIPLNTVGPAFMEQDTMVSACATTAIWMSTTTMGQRFSLPQLTTSEITELATQYFLTERSMPSGGLVAEQMTHCLRAMAYSPLLSMYFQDNKEILHTVYSYVESEIPPILLCNMATGGAEHAIVAVGHGYQLLVSNPAKVALDWPNDVPLVFSRSSEWVPYFLVHDDQRGPYRKLTPIDLDSRNPSLVDRITQAHPGIDTGNLELDKWLCPVAIEMPDGREEIVNIWGIIVPLPQGVILTCAQAEAKSAYVIRLWHWLRSLPLRDDLVLRTYLVPSNEYKNRIRNSQMNSFVRSVIVGKPMPRWIWVTEIGSVRSYNSANPANWLVSGQVIIDATSNEFTPDFLVFHCILNGRGYLATMKPDHDDAEHAMSTYWHSSQDNEYPGWVRLDS
jgi:hypothetical protein